MIEINWFGVVLAIVAGMAVAGVWYSKIGFGLVWWKLTGITSEQSKRATVRNMVQLFIANSVTAVGLAVGIAITSMATDQDSVWLAVLVGLVAWATLSATTLLQHNAFELKPPMLTVVNSSYQLVLFLAMSLVIGLL
ncbi:DUF1761 domain-containing protein [Agromyces sp. ISL-38]|uniref:DUF1761 domain-containing protein n=1 Tax=Agromyces sp. ISL-38 TaxID=2819107 RepID=UPI0020359D57|nr:DUF1761 domain-containing protein [Agromyces sp. ISL-38]